jgi:hypothetical protein
MKQKARKELGDKRRKCGRRCKNKWKLCQKQIWKRAMCDHVQKQKKGQKTSEADSFRHMKIKIYYTPEDGHVGRNI